MKYTVYYSIPKPELTDGFDITHWHNIFDKIDLVVHNAEVDISNFETEEATRVISEADRVSKEAARVASETSRGTAETSRANAEATRVSQENTRKTNETNRGTAETGRVNAETTRATQEAARQTSETGRVNAEGVRVTQEGTRQTNETARNIEFESWRDAIEGGSLGDMMKSTYDQNFDGIVDIADSANKVPWGGIQGNPITFTPENITKKGVANGYAPLDSSGLVPRANLPSSTSLKIVNNITERNGLTDKTPIVHVLDATGDATVSSGWAEYVWTGAVWVKTAEGESMDVVLAWTNITGKPSTFSPSAHNHVIQDLFFSIATTSNGQTQITIPDATFDGTKHGLDLHRNGIPLNPSEDYTISGRVITFIEPLIKNASVTTYIRIHITKALTLF